MDSSNSLIFEKMPEQYDSQILQSGKLPDVVLVAGGKEIKAHKKVLSTRSPVFAAMFAHSTKESQENRVDIIDVDVEVLEMMVRYLNTGIVDNLENNAAELLIAADKYQVECLKSLCEERLLSEISIKSISDLIIFANTYHVTELFTECVHFIINNGPQVMASKGWAKIVAKADLMDKLCGHLLVKLSELNFSAQPILSSITIESVSDLLIFSDMHKVDKFITKSLEFIAQNGTEVMATRGWKKIVMRADLLTKIFKHLYQKYIRIFDE